MSSNLNSTTNNNCYRPIPNRIFVGGLKESVKEEDLLNFFSTFGLVRDVKIIQDHSNMPKGNYGFVTFCKDGVVEKILAQDADQLKIFDKKINVNYAVKKATDFFESKQEEIKTKIPREPQWLSEEDMVKGYANFETNVCCGPIYYREIKLIQENIEILKRRMSTLVEIVERWSANADQNSQNSVKRSSQMSYNAPYKTFVSSSNRQRNELRTWENRSNLWNTDWSFDCNQEPKFEFLEENFLSTSDEIISGRGINENNHSEILDLSSNSGHLECYESLLTTTSPNYNTTSTQMNSDETITNPLQIQLPSGDK